VSASNLCAGTVKVPPHAGSFVSPLSWLQAMLDAGILPLSRSTSVAFTSLVVGDHALAVP
jgi:hypothetical protein